MLPPINGPFLLFCMQLRRKNGCIHAADEPMPFEQADLLFRTSKEYGVPISAAEFTNEPNLIALSGLPKGYTPADHARDHDLFGAWLKKHYPDCLFVGPCTVGDVDMFGMGNDGAGGGMAAGFEIVTTEALLGEGDALPELTGKPAAGTVELAPGACAFIVV